MTPLLFAAYHGRVGFGNLLLNRKGVDVNQSNLGRLNGLHLAAWKGHCPVLSQLLSAKADITALDTNDASPLHYAAQYGHASAIEYLRQHTGRGLSVNHQNRIGATPLHLAAGSGHLAAVTALFQFDGLNPNLTNAHAPGQTPFQLALARGHHDVVAFMRSQPSVIDKPAIAPAAAAKKDSYVMYDVRGTTPVRLRHV
jgi:cytohesin